MRFLRNSKTTIVMMIVAVPACSQPTEAPEVRSGHTVAATCPPPTDDETTIPTDLTGALEPWSTALSAEVSRLTRAAKEPALWCGQDEIEAYRGIWLPAYRPALMATLSRTSRGWTFTAVEFEDPRKLPPSVVRPSLVVRRFDGQPTSIALSEFLSSATRCQLWATPSWQRSDETSDGATWVIEARRNNIYRMVSRANVPDLDFEECVRTLMRSANLNPPEEMRSRGQ